MLRCDQLERYDVKTLMAGTVLAGSVALLACGDTARRNAGRTTDTAATAQDSPSTSSTSSSNNASMRNAAGKDLGTLTITQITEGSQGISVKGRLTGLPPGEHGIHLHTTGKCDPPKFTSAGDHWNPTKRQHGSRSPQGPHLGDMPNITVGSDSSADVNATTAGGTVSGDNALLDADGAAVVVHAKADDYRTQPSGNSGDRIACGVVTGS
jgi:superoxide dismutase, Cu-Zn family